MVSASRSLVLAAVAGTAMAQLTVNTVSSLITCQPALLSWSGGSAPYYVSVIPGGQSSAPALESFPQQTGTSYTWKVDIAAGTSVTVKIVDSTGDTNYNQQVTIQAGSDTSCVGQGASAASGSAAGTGAPGTQIGGGSTAAMSNGEGPSSTGAGSTPTQSSNGGGGSGSSTPSSSGGGAGAAASSASGAASQTSGAALPLAIAGKVTPFFSALGAVAAFFA